MIQTSGQQTAKPKLKILKAAPRGFCAGVDRAIQIVELALKKYGKPVYVRHEIVHNRFVVESLEAKGAVFVEDLDEIPDNNAPVIFSAHGVPKSVPRAAQKRNMFFLDATCPLVSKVHIEAERHHEMGRQIILIGHRDHPEVIGTTGQLPDGAVTLIETVADAENLSPKDPDNLAFITQTTLSLDDTAEIVDTLQRRFPKIRAPHRGDICYATTNRQAAVKVVSERAERVVVVGAPNSSNSKRLVEVAERAGCEKSILVQRATDIDWSDFQNVSVVAVTAGASAPEVLVDEVIEAFRARFDIDVEMVTTAEESIEFKVPRILREVA